MKKIYYFLFVLIPLVVLLALGVFLNTDQTESELERRTLTEKPEHVFQNAEQVEKYLSDHLPFRKRLLGLYFNLGIDFDFGTDRIILGKNDFTFLKSHPLEYNLPPIESYQNKRLFSDTEHQKIIDNLVRIKALCDENHIRLYLMFPPNKDRIYAHYMPSYILREKKPSPVKQLVRLLPPDIKVVPLEDRLIAAAKTSKEWLYYKQDSHWSEVGAFLAYQVLMENIQQDFPDVVPVSLTDFDVEYRPDIFSPYLNWEWESMFSAGSLNLPGRDLSQKVQYPHYTYRNASSVETNYNAQFVSTRNAVGCPFNVYVIGDSFGMFLRPYLEATFQQVYFYRFNPRGGYWGIRFEERLKEMLDEKTDILVISVSDLKLKDLLRAFE